MITRGSLAIEGQERIQWREPGMRRRISTSVVISRVNIHHHALVSSLWALHGYVSELLLIFLPFGWCNAALRFALFPFLRHAVGSCGFWMVGGWDGARRISPHMTAVQPGRDRRPRHRASSACLCGLESSRVGSPPARPRPPLALVGRSIRRSHVRFAVSVPVDIETIENTRNRNV